jgi:hypothetical protein
MPRLLLLTLFFLITSPLLAQSPEFYTFRQRVAVTQAGQSIVLEKPTTSLALTLGPNLPEPIRLVAGADMFRLQRDPHTPTPTTQLLVFPQAVSAIQLPDALPGDTLTLVGVYARPLRLALPGGGLARTAPADCQKPTVVAANTWRAGLTPPVSPPTATKVQFIIVHHEAGSNSPTDYTNVVRNIYVFHTQSNGWNDVGYNFLVAQDGTIYEGRDGRGVMDGDNVLGAHFCGTNTGTMGICLLGNYMTAQPSEAALTSLNRLITWKMAKEGLTNPLGTAAHAASGKTLQVISGHRDGTCATDCPGTNLYALMGQIRSGIPTSCLSGTFTAPLVLGTEPTPTVTSNVYPNPTTGQSFVVEHPHPIASVQVVTLQGQRLNVRFTRETTTRWRASLETTLPEVLVTLTDNLGAKHSQRVLIR